MKRSGSRARVKVSADGRGVVSHAGTALLRELATETGLAGAVTGALLDTYRGVPVHLPGQVFADLAVAIADGVDAVTGIEVLRDRDALFGPVASMPTAWRLLDRIDGAHLGRGAGGARGGPPPRVGGRRGTGAGHRAADRLRRHHQHRPQRQTEHGGHLEEDVRLLPLLAFLDRPEVAGGEALAGLLRPGNAGSNTAADHLTVLDPAQAAGPGRRRPLDLDHHRQLCPAPARPPPRRRYPAALAATPPARPTDPRPGAPRVPQHPPGTARSGQRAETRPRPPARIEEPLPGHPPRRGQNRQARQA